ncbi:MAG: hypothetical protein Ct9H90mP21_2330 [Methanobacteriota archaeon]|nr:MAG: hypothetical protein Ct9H90mP21_2330 [Euryarchaeota archaeon]
MSDFPRCNGIRLIVQLEVRRRGRHSLPGSVRRLSLTLETEARHPVWKYAGEVIVVNPERGLLDKVGDSATSFSNRSLLVSSHNVGTARAQ